jgi:transposase-like protein/IS1 family transposase
VTCHNCRIDCRTYGKNRNGSQRFRCTQCSKTFTEPRTRPYGNMRLDFDRGILPLEILVEGGSIRSAERISGVPRNTIIDLLLAAGENAERFLETRLRNVPATDVQADEIWTYVGKKEGHKTHGDGPYLGDAWCFIGIERNTKLVLGFELGKRTVTCATRFITKLANATDENQRFQLTTDGLNAYPYPVGNILGDRVDYAQLVKIYYQDSPEAQRRYSPARLAEAVATEVYGGPDKRKICTSHIERQNGSLRQWCKRLTRLTYAFSKKWENLRAALALHFAYYNFCRVHRTLKTSPAVAAGLTDHVWTLGELLMEAA